MDFITLEKLGLDMAGFEDPARALPILESLAGRGIQDAEIDALLPHLIAALNVSPDPLRSLTSFAAWFNALTSPRLFLVSLLARPDLISRFIHVAGCSQLFADLLIKNPEYFEILAEADQPSAAKSRIKYFQQVQSLLEVCKTPDLKSDVLRRWKAKEMLRIGVRDLEHFATMPETARDFSHLADACARAALACAADTVPLSIESAPPGFAIIGMGKLGGDELNYCSDIDLIFVHADNLAPTLPLADGRSIETSTYLNRIAERTIKILSDETSCGHVFRVDMRLRPEGRFGSLTRSLESCKVYYENWADPWEFQALLKARFVAGDRDTGEGFIRLIHPLVYRRAVSASTLAEMRNNKRKIEEKCELEGETWTNVKTGYGGIRDVEFFVQALQIEHGTRLKRLQMTSTLGALKQLYRAHLIDEQTFERLTKGYVFMRNVEHRLQLVHGFQVQNLPPIDDLIERKKIALRMGFSSLSDFEAALQSHRDNLRNTLFEQYYRSKESLSPPQKDRHTSLDAMLDNLDSPAAREQLRALLSELGFEDIPAAMHALQLPMVGNDFGEMPPDTPLVFKRIAPQLLDRASRSASPDHALAAIETVALAVPNRAQLYAAFENSPDVMDRLIRLGAGSPHLLQRLSSHLEWLEALLSPDEIDEQDWDNTDPTDVRERYHTGILDEMRRRTARQRDTDAKITTVSAIFMREALLTGAHEIWEDTDSTSAMFRMSALADTTLQILIELGTEIICSKADNPAAVREVLGSVAFIGLGKLGGCELGYASDWDLLAVHDAAAGKRVGFSESDTSAIAEQLVSTITDAGAMLITRGVHVEIDLRLRPWGRSGTLAPSLHSYIGYYKTSVETWERQAALKARYVAGSQRTGSRLVRILRAVSFGRGLTPEEELEVVAMKRRIETERLKPNARFTDLKLGFGGLMDIEWLAQVLQLKYGLTLRSVRAPGTIAALSALAGASVIDNAEADHLIAAYRLLFRYRNALWLQVGHSSDLLQENSELAAILQRQLENPVGYDDSDSNRSHLAESVRRHMQEVRAIFERIFYHSADGKSLC